MTLARVPTEALQCMQRDLVTLVDAAQFTDEANAQWVKWAKLAAANLLAEILLRERYPDSRLYQLCDDIDRAIVADASNEADHA